MEKIDKDYKRRTESPSAKFFSMWNRDGALSRFIFDTAQHVLRLTTFCETFCKNYDYNTMYNQYNTLYEGVQANF